MLILIKGAGDLATGVAHRLHRAGIKVVMTELAQPLTVRRTAAFSQSIYDGAVTVEGLTARRAAPDDAAEILARGEIPVLIDPQADILRRMGFDAVVDAVMAKRNAGTRITDAPIVLALGPGFTAGVDCHGVVETNRGPDLGRLLTAGAAAPNTGVPGDVGGYTNERVLRAGASGAFEPLTEIGAAVQAGEVVARVGGAGVVAALSGTVRGLLNAGVFVTKGMKVGDIEPRTGVNLAAISDKARAIGGGVLEGLLYFEALHSPLGRGGAERRGGSRDGTAPPLPFGERLILCGGGHVALALARLAASIDFSVIVIDDRAEFANAARFPMAAQVLALPFAQALAGLNIGAEDYCVILTRGHAHDSVCAAHILRRESAYIGMIGSKRKVALAQKSLAEAGISAEQLARLHAPVGLDIGAQTPEEIAVSIAAQLIAVRAARGGARVGLPDERGVVATITEKRGSAPRGVGARMLVRPDGSIAGTIGGGELEHWAQQTALEMMKCGETQKTARYDLSHAAAEAGMVCGGAVEVLFELRG